MDNTNATKFCKHCGEKIDADCIICPKCGKQVEEMPTQQQATSPKKGKRCPRCGGDDLTVISDVQGKGASFWKLCLCGLPGLCGTGKTTTVHYWVCQNCGNKFRM